MGHQLRCNVRVAYAQDQTVPSDALVTRLVTAGEQCYAPEQSLARLCTSFHNTCCDCIYFSGTIMISFCILQSESRVELTPVNADVRVTDVCTMLDSKQRP